MNLDDEFHPSDQSEEAMRRAFRELGEPERLFQVSPHWFRTKLAVGVALVLYGILGNYFWFMHGPGKFGHVQVEFLILPPIMGIGLLIFMYRNRGLRLLIYPTGILRLRSSEAESFAWESLNAIRLKAHVSELPHFERDSDGRPSMCLMQVKVPTFQIWNSWIQLEMADGDEVRLNPALANYNELVDLVLRRSFEYLWPRTIRCLAEGGEASFGEIAATAAGLRAGGQFLLWSEVREISFLQKTLTIKRKTGWLPWFAKELSLIPNPHLLAAIVEMMKSPGKLTPNVRQIAGTS